MRRRRGEVVGLALLTLAAFGSCRNGAGRSGDDGGGGDPDLAITFEPEADGGPLPGGACDDQHPCAGTGRCFQGSCYPDNGTCSTNDDCQNDSYCECAGGGDNGDAGPCLGGLCIPYGLGPGGLFDPSCAQPAFTADKFVAPKLKCRHDGPGSLVTTIVGDLDGDKKPEIIYASFPNTFTAIHGKDCSVYFEKDFTFAASNQSQLAIADLDGDRKPEIVGVDAGGHVVVFSNKGDLLATGPAMVNGVSWGGPAIVDVDRVAPPEIIVGGQVSRYTNKNNKPTVTEVINVGGQGAGIGWIPVAVDMDGDGKAEILTGNQVFDATTGKDKTPPAMLAGLPQPGFPAVGDFNKDGRPDIVTVVPGSPMQVSIFDFAANRFLMGPISMNDSAGGPPTVADFDGDGEPEFSAAGQDSYFVFKPACLKRPKPKQCDQNSDLGLLWKKTTQDHSSGVTGSSVFDFNGDGAAEVIYRDECWLRVYDGKTGKTLFAANVTSATACELPVVADVDNDGHADLVVTADSFNLSCPQEPEADTKTPWVGASAGVFVFQDPKNRWMPSRTLWNQHGYHITNINDDLTVPTNEKPNWLTYNNFRQNVQGGGGKAASTPDFTGGAYTGIDQGSADCSVAWTLRALLCNRGAANNNPGMVGTFYLDDPRGMSAPRPVCTTAPTQNALGPGECEDVHCDYPSPPATKADLWFRANDDGRNLPIVAECHNGNDTLAMPGAECRKVQ